MHYLKLIIFCGFLLVHLRAADFVPLVSRNGCLINAIAYMDYLKIQKEFQPVRWVKIVSLKHPNSSTGHCVCIFIWKHQLMMYDANLGTQVLTNKWGLWFKPWRKHVENRWPGWKIFDVQ